MGVAREGSMNSLPASFKSSAILEIFISSGKPEYLTYSYVSSGGVT
jgi:hypothetical protein